MAHSSNEYMKEYLKRQRDKARAFDHVCDVLTDNLKEQFIEEQAKQGYTREQSEEYLRTYCTPPDTQQEPIQPCGTATDSVPPEKRDCFGKKCEFHKDKLMSSCSFSADCYHAWLDESFKKPAQKERERNAKIYALIQENKAILRKSDLQDLIRIGAIMREVEEKREAQIDALTKKYTDRGIPEKTARESAVWEMKQIENAAARERMKTQHEWDLKTKEEQTAYMKKLMEDNKKVLRGEKIE